MALELMVPDTIKKVLKVDKPDLMMPGTFSGEKVSRRMPRKNELMVDNTDTIVYHFVRR